LSESRDILPSSLEGSFELEVNSHLAKRGYKDFPFLRDDPKPEKCGD
jgi:hypothetical protein